MISRWTSRLIVPDFPRARYIYRARQQCLHENCFNKHLIACNLDIVAIDYYISGRAMQCICDARLDKCLHSHNNARQMPGREMHCVWYQEHVRMHKPKLL